MSAPPSISVLLPVHNGMRFIGATIESILAQTFRDIELILVDDGSTDGLPGFAASIGDERLRYRRLEKVGLVDALNCGLELARAPVIARIDADDVARPDRLEKQYGRFSADPGLVLLSCRRHHIDEDGRTMPDLEARFDPVSDAAIRWTFLFGNPILHPGAMFSRAEAIAAGGYRRRYKLAEDYDLWTRLSRRGRMGVHPDRLMYYRVHPGSVSASNSGPQLRQVGVIAGEYASLLSPGLDADRVAELALLAAGKEPERHSMRDLARTFRVAAGLFEGEPGDGGAEVRGAIEMMRRRFRWFCMSRSRANWSRPRVAYDYLRAAGVFDPEEGSVGRIVSRRLGALRRPSRRGSRHQAHAPSP